MTIRKLLLGGAAAFLVATTGMPDTTGLPLLSSSAMAATDESITVGTFYDRLASDGDWVQYHGAAVFIPTKVQDGWRPYTVGHWVHTKQYGWLWVTDEKFGWATYHYGRWGYADEVGWYWVPGTRWAPAWVSWKRDRGHVIWAPLPPRRGGDDLVAFEISYDEIPDYYWVAVPTRDFLEPDLSAVIIRDNRERVRIVGEAEPIGEVTVQNNIVVNNFVSVNIIEQETKKQVTTVDALPSKNPEQTGAVQNNTISIFDANVKASTNAKPAKLKEIAEVSQLQTNRKLKPTEKAVEPVAGQPTAVTPKDQPAPADKVTQPAPAADPKKVTPKDQPAPADKVTQPAPAPAPKQPKVNDQPDALPQKLIQPGQGGETAKPKKAPGKACDPATDANC